MAICWLCLLQLVSCYTFPKAESSKLCVCSQTCIKLSYQLQNWNIQLDLQAEVHLFWLLGARLAWQAAQRPMVPVLVNFPLLCLELHCCIAFFPICRQLEIWISKIVRISDLCTPCSFSLLPSVASTSCWWEWCDKALFNFLQEQFLTLLCT